MKYHNYESIAQCLTNIPRANLLCMQCCGNMNSFPISKTPTNHPQKLDQQFLPLPLCHHSERPNLHTLPMSLPLRARSNRLRLPNHNMQLNRLRAPFELDIDFLLETVLLIVRHVGLGARLEVCGAVFEVRLFISCQQDSSFQCVAVRYIEGGMVQGLRGGRE
jgi:hypothetical protein